MKHARASSYIIPVKLKDGRYMLIHGYTGAVDIITEGLLKKIESVSQRTIYLSKQFKHFRREDILPIKIEKKK